MTVTKKLVLAALGIAVFVSCEKVVAPGSISQFAISPNSVTLQPNQIQDFTAVGYTSTGDSADVAVTWTATGGTVDATDNGRRHYGHYHSADCGVFHVVATTHPGDLTDSAVVTVAGCSVSVASVAVSPASATVSVNQSVHLSATPKDANGNALIGRAIVWSSSNTSVAVADVNGNVTGLAPGSATITATSEGQTGTATITVTDVAVASVAVSPASASVAAGTTVQLTATTKDANGNTLSGRVVTWSSSNTAAAVVNASGLVTGVAAGSATIMATSEGQSGTATITVTAVPVASVTVTPASAGVPAGNTVQLTATPKDANGNTLSGRAVTWSSSNTAAASVSSSGLVTGIAAGSATITATSEGQSGTATITVQPALPPGCQISSLTWATTPLASPQNGSFTFEFDATANGSSLDAITGLSAGTAATFADLAVITRFNATGTIDARNGGAYAAASAIPYTAGTGYHFRLIVDVPSHTYAAYVTPAGGTEQTIGTGFAFRTEQNTATSLADWVLYSDAGTHTVCNATVSGTVPPVPVASVSVSPATASVPVGGTVQLTATPKDANGNPLSGRTVSWSSSNTAVANVSATGLVSGVAAGSATITATSEGQSGTAAITAANVPVATVDVTPATASVSEGQTVQLTATPRDATGNALSGRTVSWASSNTAVATVNGSGLVTGKVAGTVTITATSETKSGSATVTVVHVPVASVTVSPASATVTVGATLQLTATPKDANGNALAGRTVTWASSNAAVANVSASGLVTGVAAGTATITATSEGQTGSAALTVVPPGTSQFGHVFIVLEENTNYASVIGSSSMPYLNGLAQQYGLATQYYANTHPSIGNYFWLSTGQVVTNLRREHPERVLPGRRHGALRAQAQHLRAAVGRGERSDGPGVQHRAVHPVRDRSGERDAAGLLQHRARPVQRRARLFVEHGGHVAQEQHRSADQERDVPAGRAVDHRVRRGGGRQHQRWRPHSVGSGEPEVETGLPVDHAVSASEHAALDAEVSRRDDISRRRGHRARHG